MWARNCTRRAFSHSVRLVTTEGVYQVLVRTPDDQVQLYVRDSAGRHIQWMSPFKLGRLVIGASALIDQPRPVHNPLSHSRLSPNIQLPFTLFFSTSLIQS